MNISELKPIIKGFRERILAEWGISIIVFLVALASFGLGRLSVIESARPAISINSAAAVSAARSIAQGGLFVASRTGEKFFYPWCSGAQSIADANKVWFQSEKAARAAGYEPAKNCKGLK